MASTEQVVSTEDTEAPVTYTRRFVASASGTDTDDVLPGSTDPSEQVVDLSTRTLVVAMTMIVFALLLFVVSFGFGGGSATVTNADAQKIFGIRKQIQTVQARTDALPDTKDAQRGLTAAQSAGDAVAGLQNGYRYLTADVADDHGKLPATPTAAAHRNLVPYFAPSVPRRQLDPWYLLKADDDAATGVGTSTSFDSGFAWDAQTPLLINDDGSAEVTWLAVKKGTTTAQGTVVLAWAQAKFDLTRNVFSGVQVATTATGEDLRQAVAAS